MSARSGGDGRGPSTAARRRGSFDKRFVFYNIGCDDDSVDRDNATSCSDPFPWTAHSVCQPRRDCGISCGSGLGDHGRPALPVIGALVSGLRGVFVSKNCVPCDALLGRSYGDTRSGCVLHACVDRLTAQPLEGAIVNDYAVSYDCSCGFSWNGRLGSALRMRGHLVSVLFHAVAGA